MAKSIKTDQFEGMATTLKKAKASLAVPSMILNATVDQDGSLEKRDGHTLVADLPGAHSLWTNGRGLVLCMADGIVYRLVDGSTVEKVTDTWCADAPVSYLEAGGMVYLSNRNWTGMYDPINRQMFPWGEAVPPAPILLPIEGGLLAGTYQVCLTVNGQFGRPSGNSPVATITLEDDGGGIRVVNCPDGASIWMTDPDGATLQYAGSHHLITEHPEEGEPLPTMWGGPPPPLSCATWAFGRVWGAHGNKLLYSEPYQPELFRTATAYFEVPDEILMVARSKAGIFIGCKGTTWFLVGTDPETMYIASAGRGVVPGSLCYANHLGELGKDVPIWVGMDGVYAGLQDGQTVNLVKDRIELKPQQLEGASICRVKDGRRQMLFAMKHQPAGGGGGSGCGFGDSAACEVVRKGSVI